MRQVYATVVLVMVAVCPALVRARTSNGHYRVGQWHRDVRLHIWSAIRAFQIVSRRVFRSRRILANPGRRNQRDSPATLREHATSTLENGEGSSGSVMSVPVWYGPGVPEVSDRGFGPMPMQPMREGHRAMREARLMCDLGSARLEYSSVGGTAPAWQRLASRRLAIATATTTWNVKIRTTAR